MSQSQIEKDFDEFQKTLAEALGYTYDIEIGRPPGGSGKHRQALQKAYKKLGLGAPKLWHFDDMSKYQDSTLSKFGWILRKPHRTKKFIDQIKNKESDVIILFHEKTKRADYLKKFLEALKEHYQGPPSSL